MPPKRKAVNAVVDPSRARRQSQRLRHKQLQTPAEPVSDAGHLETNRAMSSAPKQNAAAKKTGPWGEDYLMTNPKSALAHADLVRLFSNPKAWECLDENEKRELISLLPAHIHPSPDPDPENPDSKILPLPESFLRYDNNWRAALRNFQYDLEAGRYKPQWQAQARQAVQDRAQGKFDDFKEREFEQFWGQKQKLNHGVVAGESSKVKLETLIQHEIVRVGDVWKYRRIFGTKNDPDRQTIVEKEAKITAIDGSKLSFLVPVGQRVFLCVANEPADDVTDDIDTQMNTNSSAAAQEDERALSDTQKQPRNDEPTKFNMTENFDHASQHSLGGDAENKEDDHQAKEDDSAAGQPTTPNEPKDDEKPLTKRGRGRPPKRKAPDNDVLEDAAPETKMAKEAPEDADAESSHVIENSIKVDSEQSLTADQEKESHEASPPSTTSIGVDSPEDSKSSQVKTDEPQPEENEALSPTSLEKEIHNITGPSALAKMILRIDGRIENPPNGNAWKEFRCYRNNQDMGTLWDVRQAWYVKFQPES